MWVSYALKATFFLIAVIITSMFIFLACIAFACRWLGLVIAPDSLMAQMLKRLR